MAPQSRSHSSMAGAVQLPSRGRERAETEGMGEREPGERPQRSLYNLRGKAATCCITAYPMPSPLSALQGAVEVVLYYMELEANASVHELFPVLEPICVFFLNESGHNGPYMCPGILYSYGPVVSSVLQLIPTQQTPQI